MTHQIFKISIIQKEKPCQSSPSNRSLSLGHIPWWFGKVSQQPSHCKLCGTTSACALPDVPPSWKKKRLTDSCWKWWCFFDSYLFFPKKNPCFNMFSRCCHLGALFQWMWNVFSICSSLFCAVSVWQQLLLLSCASRKLCSKVACLAEHGEDGDMQGLPSMLGAIARILLSPFKKKYKEV